MTRRRTAPRSDFFRVCVSSLAAAVGAVVVLAVRSLVTGETIDYADPTPLLVTAYLVTWPLYVALYVAWSSLSFSRLDTASLRRVTLADDREERHLLPRVVGASGATNTTVSAAVFTVSITVAIAQTPEFRDEPFYIVLSLLMVASSWALMVFSFAQSYMRLGSGAGTGTHIRFPFADAPRFGDYVTLAVLLSTMAATVSADITSRRAWRIVRTNVVIAFVFNSVIIAMMVSLLFGGLLA